MDKYLLKYLGQKHTASMLNYLVTYEMMSFSDFLKRITPELNHTLLSDRLKIGIMFNIISKRQDGKYELAPYGKRLIQALEKF